MVAPYRLCVTINERPGRTHQGPELLRFSFLLPLAVGVIQGRAPGQLRPTRYRKSILADDDLTASIHDHWTC